MKKLKSSFEKNAPIILLNREQILKNIHDNRYELLVFESLSSTSDYLKELDFSKERRLICLAEQQTKGRGRFERKWFSPFGENIYLSFTLPLRKPLQEISGLPLLVTLSVFYALREYGIGSKLFVKWPNDIIYEEQKLAGILIEIHKTKEMSYQIIIGIGVNVNMSKEEEGRAIKKPYTSMRMILNRYVNRNDFCSMLLNQAFSLLEIFEKNSFSMFRQSWMENDYLMNRHIVLKDDWQEKKGKMIGVNEHGHLLLQLETGEIKTFSSGETSVISPFLS